MVWNLDKKRPVCPQICEQICVFIASGALLPDQRLPSVREVALQAGVNPNTVQHSLETLGMLGILYPVRGSGWYVTEDTTAAKAELARLIRQKTAAFFAEMSTLGVDPEDVKNIVKEYEHE